MQSSASESYPFEIYSKVEISRKARREERLSRSKLKWVLLIDSHAELFIHLIQCIRFGIWKIWRLYRALKSFQVTRVFRVPRTQEETLIQKKLRQSNSNWINSQIANICGRKERKIIFYTLDYFLAISIFWYQIGSRLCKMNTLTFCWASNTGNSDDGKTASTLLSLGCEWYHGFCQL